MKILILYYSRTSTTKKVAEYFSQKLWADLEEIQDTKDRKGAMWYILSGRDAIKKNLTLLKDLKSDISSYDLVVIWWPIWWWNISTPIRTFCHQYKDVLKNNVAYFCTMWGSWDITAFKEMELITWKTPISTFSFVTQEVQKGTFTEKADLFLEKIR